MLRWALRGLSAGSDALGKHHRSSGLPGTGLRQRKSMARWDRQGVSCRGSVPASRDKATPGIQHLSQQPGAQDNEQTCQRSSPAVQGTHVRALVPTAAPRRRNFKRCPLSPGKSGAELQLTLERNAAKAKRTTTSSRHVPRNSDDHKQFKQAPLQKKGKSDTNLTKTIPKSAQRQLPGTSLPPQG